ncbi:hypothetical protein HZC32_03875 [Candidatus Woesearchaeota archaeon]|nr:hypothetical protein [Candidatus Woesearchaeota archaeon]
MGIDKQKIWMGVGILFFVGVIAFFVGYMVASQQEMVGKAISDKHISSVKKISNVETVCNDGIDNNNNDLIDCADPDCAGKPSGDGNICCMTNKDCSKFKGTNCNANYCENSEQCQDRCKQEKDFCSLGGSIPLVCG